MSKENARGMQDEAISREAVITEIGRWAGYLDDDMIRRIQIGIKRLQPIQPEIIRCKDCKWWDRYNDNNGYCMAAKSCTYTSHWDIQIRRTYDGDFYCAHAEPKEEYEEDEDE